MVEAKSRLNLIFRVLQNFHESSCVAIDNNDYDQNFILGFSIVGREARILGILRNKTFSKMKHLFKKSAND